MVDLLDKLDLEKLINEVSQKLIDSPPQLTTIPINHTNTQPNPNLELDINLNIDINEPIIQFDNEFNQNCDNNESQSPTTKKSTLSLSSLKNDSTLLINPNSYQKEEYLTVTDWKISHNDNYPLIQEQFNALASLINKTHLNQLALSIRNSYIEKAQSHLYSNIGPLSTLESLVEDQFFYDKSKKDQISFHIVQLEDYLFRWRKIKGDGNCFYRAMIFSFLENIIMTHNICLLQEIIIDMNNKLNETNNNTRYLPFIRKEIEKIDKRLTIHILLLLEESMDANNEHQNSQSIIQPYEILIKSFLFCEKFDYCMIFYLRFLLFEFIKANWNKVYSTNFSIKIGNLLPVEYETQSSDFLYDKFFEQNLLKMGSDAEKIVIYLTPIVLRCDLNVIMYNFDFEEEAVSPASFPSFLENKPKIEVLYRKTHYDILYSKAYYTSYSKELNYYLNFKEKQRITTAEDLIPIRSLKRQSYETQVRLGMIKDNNNIDINAINLNTESSTYSNIKETIKIQCPICKKYNDHITNILNLCSNCLSNEIDNQIFTHYLQYIYQAKELWNTDSKYQFSQLFNQLFREQTCVLAGHKMTLTSAAQMSGHDLNEIMTNLKKKICVQCLNTIKSLSQIWYTMPCNCVFCSKKCLEAYFNMYLQSRMPMAIETKNYSLILDSCICGYQFNNNDYITLYRYFEEIENKKLKKSIKDVIVKKLMQGCLLCLSNRESKYLRLKLKDEKFTKVFKEKEFEHIICHDCLDKSNTDFDIDCLLCGSRHQIVKISPLIEDEEEDDCIVF